MWGLRIAYVEAMNEVKEIGTLERRSVDIEIAIEMLIDALPEQSPEARKYQKLLSELADTYQELASAYKKLAGI